MKRLVPFAVLGALSLASISAHADDADKEKEKPAEHASSAEQLDKPHYPPTSTRFKVLALGVILTGGAWGVSYGMSRAYPEDPTCVADKVTGLTINNCVAGPPGSKQLGIPIAGPWIALGKSGCATDDPNCSSAKIGVRAGLYVLDGIIQAGGIALIIESLVMKTEPAAPKKTTSAFALHYRGVELAPLPIVTPTMSGMGFVGTF